MKIPKLEILIPTYTEISNKRVVPLKEFKNLYPEKPVKVKTKKEPHGTTN